ncbi:MAG: DUF1574 domain-containing protein [Cyanobacteria bacterium J06627_32]
MLGHLHRQQARQPAGQKPKWAKSKRIVNPSTLIPWLRDTLLAPEQGVEADIQVRLRGNILHVLCEAAEQALPRSFVLMRLVRSLLQPEVKARFETEFPQVYQVYVYSRRAQQRKPAWSAPIYLNRLERHLERLVESAENVRDLTGTAGSVDVPTSSEQLSDISLARQGDSDAIARYLSEALSSLNVGVQVSARVVPGKARRTRAIMASHSQPVSLDISGAISPPASESAEAGTASGVEGEASVEGDVSDASDAPAGSAADGVLSAAADGLPAKTLEQDLVSRLWVFCEASYSPDPLLIAEPIAERLRLLRLQQFQDAVITIQVTGEAASEWRLRVDLTPPEEMLKEWGRWGDVPALSQLVNQIANPYGLKLVTEVKKETLHLISYPINPVDGTTGAPLLQSADLCRKQIDVNGLVASISETLGAIAPQGLHRAMLYGPSTDDISPEWLRGVDLPGVERVDRMASTVSLAAGGNLPALAYCLTRALNPDIKEQLATGGIRVQLLIKDSLLHIMADGPVCPPKHGIVPLIVQTLKQIQPPDIEGLRLYGRRAGQKQPIWSHGYDYQHRQRLVPEAKPEFAASDAYAGELITAVSDESLAGVLGAAEEDAGDVGLGRLLLRGLRRVMVKSQIFTPAEENGTLAVNLPGSFQSDGLKMAFFWGAAGLFLAIQFDFLVGQALRQVATRPTDDGVEEVRPSQFNDQLANLEWPASSADADRNWRRSRPAEDEFFSGRSNDRLGRSDERDFTSSAINDSELVYSPQQEFVSTATLLADSNLPSFRSQQLDEKLALYRRQVALSGPPDVLVIGSSRALRGVDPAALRQSLDALGHEDLKIFNFGVNGATAQVVDLVVRRLIPPNQLPQMIVWADGARAFNSGRTDVTFNAIAVSEGYRQLEATDPADGVNGLALGSLADQLTMRATETDRQLSEVFGKASSAYTHRRRIRSAIGQGFGAIAPEFSGDDTTSAGATPTGLPTETSLIDYDGFLALSTRFNPATYYQDHPRVAGAYDGDYKSFRLEGEQADALRGLIRYTSERDIPVVFVNTPLTDEYLDSHRLRAEVSFQQYMLQMSERYADFTFRDLGRLWPQRYDYFSDPSHLNRYGAYQVSQRISQDPLIPWPQARPTED